MHNLVQQHPRYGYRRIHEKLRKQGFMHNIKTTYRLWRQEGFKVPKKRKKRRAKGTSKHAQHISPSQHINDVWAWDYVHDIDEKGRTVRWLVMTDEYTSELLLLESRRRFPAKEVHACLLKVISQRGLPKRIRSDNGSEFIESKLLDWLSKNQIEACHIDPGKPWQNAKAESLNSRLRDEFFEMESFSCIREAQTKGDAFRYKYNHEREHSSLGNKTPAEFAATLVPPSVVATLLPLSAQACYNPYH
jgi:transposase InsO family protein